MPLSVDRAEVVGRERMARTLGVTREFWVRRTEELESGERAVMECLWVRVSGSGWAYEAEGERGTESWKSFTWPSSCAEKSAAIRGEGAETDLGEEVHLLSTRAPLDSRRRAIPLLRSAPPLPSRQLVDHHAVPVGLVAICESKCSISDRAMRNREKRDAPSRISSQATRLPSLERTGEEVAP